MRVASLILFTCVLHVMVVLILKKPLHYLVDYEWFTVMCAALALAAELTLDIWSRTFGLSPNKGDYRHYYEPWVHPVKHLRGWLKLGLLFAAFFACVHYNVWSVVCQDMVIVFTQPWARNWGTQVYARLCAYGHEILLLFKR